MGSIYITCFTSRYRMIQHLKDLRAYIKAKVMLMHRIKRIKNANVSSFENVYI